MFFRWKFSDDANTIALLNRVRFFQNPLEEETPLNDSHQKPWIAWVDDAEADGEVGDIYNRWKAANPTREFFPEILKCFSGNAEVLRGVLDFTYPLQFNDGQLTRKQKELIATFVSALNKCKY